MHGTPWKSATGISFFKTSWQFSALTGRAVRILHRTEFYAGVGALERSLHRICGALEAHGHASSVVFSTARGGEPSDSRAAHHVLNLVGPATNDTLVTLQEVLEKEQPDVLVVHELCDPLILAWSTARYPSVRCVWGFKLICPGGKRIWRKPGQVCPRPVGYMCQVVTYKERCMPRDFYSARFGKCPLQFTPITPIVASPPA